MEWKGEHCQICGKAYAMVYVVPNDIWAKITPKKGESGLLCVECADYRARELGIKLYWEAGENDFPKYRKKVES